MYYGTMERVLQQQPKHDLSRAMRQTSVACRVQEGHQDTKDTASPNPHLRSMVRAMWQDKRDVHGAVHSHDPRTQHAAQDTAGHLHLTKKQLKKLH